MFPNMHSPNAEYYVSWNQLFKGIWGSYLKDKISHQQLGIKHLFFIHQYNILPIYLKRNEVYFNRENRSLQLKKELIFCSRIKFHFQQPEDPLGFSAPHSLFFLTFQCNQSDGREWEI